MRGFMLCMQQWWDHTITDHLEEQPELAHHPLIGRLLSSGRGQQQEGVVGNCIFSLIMGSSSEGARTLSWGWWYQVIINTEITFHPLCILSDLIIFVLINITQHHPLYMKCFKLVITHWKEILSLVRIQTYVLFKSSLQELSCKRLIFLNMFSDW